MNVVDSVALPFKWGSALRHRRVFHPRGVVAQGSFERVAPPEEGLPMTSGPVVARVSKALGSPGPVPDIGGLAWRTSADAGGDARDGAAWDVLLASVTQGFFGRAVLRPLGSWSDALFSSLLPIRYEDSAWWVRGRIVTPIPERGLSLDVVSRHIGDGGLDVEIEQAKALADFRPLARLSLTALAPHVEVSFDPVRNEAPGVELMPSWLTGLRRAAYRRSRQGRQDA
jgi:hypothetical protein